jgi:glycosyltransferase involved in cell wall biosynthesis
VEGYAEQVGDAGLLIDPTSANDLAQAIYAVFSDAALRNKLIEKGKARFQSLTAGNYGKQILEIVQSVLPGKGL